MEVYELTIAKLIQQIEEHSVAMEALRESESNLRLSLRQSEQVALDAQTKLLHVEERYVVVVSVVQVSYQPWCLWSLRALVM